MRTLATVWQPRRKVEAMTAPDRGLVCQATPFVLRFSRCFQDQARVRASSGAALREQRFLDDHQVCEGEQRVQLRGVLG